MNVSEEDEAVIRVLSVDGQYDVLLVDGRMLDVINICWGQDFNEIGFHISTNDSPPDPRLHSDFFRTRDVVNISVDGKIVLSTGRGLAQSDS